jgi:hypothetical protein
MKTTKRAKAKRPAKSPTKPRKLTVRQERFCELIAAGRSGTDAWIEAGHDCTRPSARALAAAALTNDSIKAKIAQLRAPQTAATLLTRDRKRELLRQIAEKQDAPLDVRIRAMAEDSRMAGHYEPDRTEIDVGPRTLQSIRERAATIHSSMVAKYSRK